MKETIEMDCINFAEITSTKRYDVRWLLFRSLSITSTYFYALFILLHMLSSDRYELDRIMCKHLQRSISLSVGFFFAPNHDQFIKRWTDQSQKKSKIYFADPLQPVSNNIKHNLVLCVFSLSFSVCFSCISTVFII